MVSFRSIRVACLPLLAVMLISIPLQADETAQAINHAKALSLAFRQAAMATMPAVVTIVSKEKPNRTANAAELREMLRDPRFRRMFPNGDLPFDIPTDDSEVELPPLVSQVGSGVIVDAAGILITNNHVVENADEIVVRLGDGREFIATDVKMDPLSDLAVVTVKTSDRLPAAKLGDSSKLTIGDWVIAIGSPFELEATVSAGIISGKGRGIDKIRRGKLVQTDAAINPGNSGGPLVNLDGEVVGINTAIASSNGGYQGIGFAIPSNRVAWVSRELLAHGKVRRAYLGIRIDDLSPETAAKLGMAPRSGVFVVDVIDGAPAAQAGLRINDVIIEFAGERVRGPRDLQDVVEQKPIDSEQKVTVMRRGERKTVDVKLTALDE